MLLGGEPSLIPNAYGILDTASRNRSGPDTLVTVITNVTRAPRPDGSSCSAGFVRSHVIASIDDIGIRNDYIRSPSRWADVPATLDASRPHVQRRRLRQHHRAGLTTRSTCTDVSLRRRARLWDRLHRGHGSTLCRRRQPAPTRSSPRPWRRIDRFAGEFAPTSQPGGQGRRDARLLQRGACAAPGRGAGRLPALHRRAGCRPAANRSGRRASELAERLDQDQARHRTQHPVPAPSGGIRLAEAG